MKLENHRLIMLAGEEEVLRRRSLDEILQNFNLTKDDFDLEMVDADSSEPSSWFGSVSTIPFMAERRTLIVRHLLKRDPATLGSVDLGKVPASGLLILIGDSEMSAEDRTAKHRKAWEKVVTAAKGLILNFDPDPKRAKATVKAEVARLEKTMTDRAMDTLVDMTGGSSSRALDELEKLTIYVGSETQIQEDDVRAVVSPSREWNVFKMVDAVVQNQPGEALKQLRILITSSSKADEAAFRQILPQVSRNLRLLYQARICVEAHCSPSDAPAAIKALFPDRPNLANESPYRQGPMMQAAQRLTLVQISRGLQILGDADARLKGALPGFSSMETLERMIMELSKSLAVR